MENQIEIYQTPDNQTRIEVRFEEETVWLNQYQLAELFQGSRTNIVEHIKNIYMSEELDEKATCRKFRQVRTEGKRKVTRLIDHYNLDLIISVGYRINSRRGTQFRQWATRRLKDYLVQGYAINEQRLAEKQQHVEYLKTGIRILSRAITEQATSEESEMLKIFAGGLDLLDDYDFNLLDTKGITDTHAVYPGMDDYLRIVREMKSRFSSGVFAIPKDQGFESSIGQIRQSFGGVDLYPSIEEKAATLLYLIVKNHSFVDGNKRIGAACFLYFLEKNNVLFNSDSHPIISNEALAALTLFVASSQTEEMEIVKNLIISILNRKKR